MHVLSESGKERSGGDLHTTARTVYSHHVHTVYILSTLYRHCIYSALQYIHSILKLWPPICIGRCAGCVLHKQVETYLLLLTYYQLPSQQSLSHFIARAALYRTISSDFTMADDEEKARQEKLAAARKRVCCCSPRLTSASG